MTELLAAQRTTLGGPQIGDIKHTARIFLDPLWLWADGSAYSRTTYALLLAAITVSTTGTINGTTTVSALPISLVGLGLEGAAIEGTNIPANTTVSSVTSNTITLSQSATGSGSIAIRIFPYGNGDGSSSFNVPKYNGATLVTRDNQGAATANLVGTVSTDSGTIVGSRLNSKGGSSTHVLQLSETPSFSYTPNGTVSGSVGNEGTILESSGLRGLATGRSLYYLADTIGASLTWGGTFSGSSATLGGSGDLHAIMQPSVICNVWIMAGA